VSNDWSHIGGVARDGKSAETGLLKQWPAGGPALVWKVKNLGAGMGGVAVTGSRVYTSSDTDGSACAIALNESDGHEIWRAKVGKGGSVGGGANSYEGPRGTPSVSDGHVYIVTQYGDVSCLDAANGKEIWHKSLPSDLSGKMMSGWGFSESPLVDGDKVIVTPGGSRGTLAALNAATGEVIWRTKAWTDSAAYASAIAATIGDVHQYIQLTDKSVAGVNPTDGAILWKAPRKGTTAVIPTVIYSDGYVYVTSGYGIGCDLFKISSDGGKFTATPVYSQNKLMKNHHGGVVLVDGKIYGYSDQVGWVCQDFVTGKEVWKEKNKLGKGSIAYADGHLYLRQEDRKGTIALIEASPAGYNEVGHFDQPDRSSENSWPHPVIANGKLYIRDQETLLCYDVKAK